MIKKSQISFNLIFLSIILIIILSFFFFLHFYLEDTSKVDSIFHNKLKNYVEVLAKEILIEGIFLISLNGGNIYGIENQLLTPYGNFTLYLKNETSIPEITDIELELEKYFNIEFKKRLNQINFEGFEINLELVNNHILINRDEIIAEFDIKTFIEDEVIIELNHFAIKLFLNLGNILEKRDHIIKNFNDDPNELLNYLSNELEVDLIYFNHETLFFSIYDNKTFYRDLIYNFALESNNLDFNFNTGEIINFEDIIIDYVKLITTDLVLDAIYSLSFKGGILYPNENTISTELSNFLIISNKNNIDENFVKFEIEKYLFEFLEKKLDGYFDHIFDINFDLKDIDFNIYKENIKLEILLGITILNKDYNNLFKIDIDIPTKFGLILEHKNKIIENFYKDPNDVLSLIHKDLEINFYPFNNNIKIVSIVDYNTEMDMPLVYNFGIKYNNSFPIKLKLMPDFVTSKNIPIQSQIETISKNNDLNFFTNNSIVNLNSKSGKFNFSSNKEGMFEIEFCVSNYFSNDCQVVKINVI